LKTLKMKQDMGYDKKLNTYFRFLENLDNF